MGDYQLPTSKVATPVVLVDENGDAYEAGGASGGATELTLQTVADAVHAEDAAHASADKGMLALGVRLDTAAALAGTSGDYQPMIFTADGKAWVSGTYAIDAVAGASDLGHPTLVIRTDSPATITPAAGDWTALRVDQRGHLWVAGSQIEDAASADGDRGLAVLGVRQDTLAASVGTDGDYGFLKFDNLGRLWVTGTWLEDAAHSSGHAGMFVLAVRNDTLSALAGTTGDYIPFTTDSLGRLWTVGAYAEDAAHTSGDYGLAVWGVRKDSPTALAGTDGDYQPFIFGADGALWVGLTSQGYVASASVTRPADTTAYGAYDVIGPTGGGTATMTFATMGPASKPVRITNAELEIDDSGLISGESGYRLYLFSATQPSAQADNAAFNLVSGDRSVFLGYIDFPSPQDLGNTLYCQSEQMKDVLLPASGNLYGVLTTSAPYTPTSARGPYKVTLHTALL